MQKDFQKGDYITFAGEVYRVLQNFGESGEIEYPDGEFVSNNFYWKFEGEECQLLISKDEIVGLENPQKYIDEKNLFMLKNKSLEYFYFSI